jgi:hypothetical protein
MIDNVKNRKAEISLSRAVGAIDNTILNDIIFDGIQVKTKIAVPGEVQLNLFLESPEIFYRKLGKHNTNVCFLAQIYKQIINIRNFFTENHVSG